MGSVPAICGYCGHSFPSAISIRGGASALLRGNKQTCPACGQMAAISDGIYKAVGDTLYQLEKFNGTIDDAVALMDALAEVQADPNRHLGAALAARGHPGLAAISTEEPDKPADRGVWAGVLLAGLSVAWNQIPQGALSWIELIQKAKEFFGS